MILSYNNPIKIYVSKGSDISFNNGNYYRFYNESFNLINISTSSIESTLTNSGDNFYFMRNMNYEFIATTDFSNIHPFCISGSSLSNLSDLSLNMVDSSFTFLIPDNINNSDNKIFYQDLNHPEISGNLKILVDSNNINYYYGDISFSIDPSYGTDFSDVNLSIKSYPFENGVSEISNNNLFKYNTFCNYIFEGITEIANILIIDNQECLNLVSKSYLKLNPVNNKYYYEFNTGNHGTNEDNITMELLNYGVYDSSYIIFNINEKYPITIVNNEISNNIYIDEDYYRTNKIHKN